MYETLIDRLKAITSMLDLDKNILLMGDFNINFLIQNKKTQELLDVLNACNLSPLFSEPSTVYHKNCIDNVFADITKCVYTKVSINLHISDHLAQIIKFKRPIRKGTEKYTKKVRPYTLVNIQQFIELWPSAEFLTSSEIRFQEFHSLFISIFERVFPEKTIKISKNNERGIYENPQLARMKNDLDILSIIMTATNDEESYRMYRQSKKQYLEEHTRLNQQKNAEYIENADNKTIAIWDIIRKETNTITQTRKNSTLRADELNHYFSHVGENIAKSIQNIGPPDQYMHNCIIENSKSFFFMPLTEPEVISIVNKLKWKNFRDIYGMSTAIMKQLINTIAEPLTYTLNECIQSGVFPDELKIARVVPIYKKGDINECSSYRPISILPVISKIFEQAMAERIAQLMELNNYMSDKQHGFLKNRSVDSAVLSVVEYICDAYDKGMAVKMNMLDLSKAFDSVDRSVLLRKLQYYGIRGPPLELLRSYLSNRYQAVVWQNEISQMREVTFGVPQGSILGPLLFLIFINDLPNNFGNSENDICLYADDTTLLVRARTSEELETLSRETLSDVMDWFSANRLKANQEKTQSVTFTTKATQDREHARFLGVYLDSCLRWDWHIDHLASRLTSAVYAIRRLRTIATKQAARTAYFSMFHASMTYGIMFWGISTEATRIFKLQKQAVRSLANLKYNESCRGVFKMESILTLASQYILTCVKYVHNHLHTFKRNSDNHQYDTRHCHDLSVAHHRLAMTQKYIDYWGLKLYNALPPATKSKRKEAFAIDVKRLLLQKECYTLEEFFSL